MKLIRWQGLLLTVSLLFGLASCGVDEFLAAVQVLPQNATAIAGSSAATVEFSAIGW